MPIENFVLRPIKLIGGILSLLTGINNIFSSASYMSTLVCFYLCFFSFVIITNSISKTIIETYFSSLFPFLCKSFSEGVFLIIISSLCFGGEMEIMGKFSGVLLLITGCGLIILNLSQQKPNKKLPDLFANDGYIPPQPTNN
ncbi:hypothetical protein SteCoe_11067 [Stentor coeruleus]|uniref:COPI associated protein n=1 Tax=Stentor coeruleus TaxID=5963 RepID=A0A1R2CE31_9CILI|nr:hypothetical protein SteCoe_11067 [Stentor coeruleus]